MERNRTRDLLEAARNGDEDARATLLTRCRERAKRITGRKRRAGLRNVILSSDIAQSVVAGIMGSALARIESSAGLEALLRTRVGFKVRDKLRKASFQREKSPVQDADGSDVAPLGVTAETAERVVLQSELRQILDEEIAALSAEDRDLFVLHVVEGRPWADVAAVVGRSVEGARARYAQYVLPALRRRLDDWGLAS